MTVEPLMRKAFGGERVPQWVLDNEAEMENVK